MAELKTQVNDNDVTAFVHTIENEAQQKDSFQLLELLESITQEKPKMWGTNIIGFGSCQLKYESGRELDWFSIGFAPRKSNIVLYFRGYLEQYESILKQLGKFKTGKGCLYINKLSDIKIDVLKELLQMSLTQK